MALTVQKRTFAELIESGLGQTEAAIAAGYSEKHAASKASHLMRDKDVLEHIAKLKQDRSNLADRLSAEPDESNYRFKTGESFLRWMMNNDMAEDKIRNDAAKKLYDGEKEAKGKKAMEQQKGEQTAQQSSRFGALAAPPTISIN